MLQLTAAGGVVYRGDPQSREILMILRNGVWDLPKGKREENEELAECALREVAEEAGIPLPEIEIFLCRSYHQYSRNGKRYGKTTFWYMMNTPVQTDFTPQHEEGIEAVKWVPLNQAMQQAGYENLKKVLGAFKKINE